MGIIEKHIGCPEIEGAIECWGPVGEYYTVFGTEVGFLTGHLTISIILGLIIFAVLFS